MTSPVHAGRALLSLRNSGFDTLSSMGEVIDNALQAGAGNVRIRLQKAEVGKNRYDITEIAFADDGSGMGAGIIGKCMQLGFSGRYNDRKGIGRFGVGMTLGAVAQCTRIEVYSKPRGGGWNLACVDLDRMRGEEDAAMQPPEPAEIPRGYADLVQDHGTLVIWKNLDRGDATAEEMKTWIGRTYRKFIGEETIREEGDESVVVKNPDRRRIFLDDGDSDEEVHALDPLRATRTKYGGETADLERPIFVEEIASRIDPPPAQPTGPGKITIRMSLAPAGWRRRRGAPRPPRDNPARGAPGGEGVSILRNGREVFYGRIPDYRITDNAPGRREGFLDLDRFWGCEISFNAEMDHWFSIRSVKVGAKPLPELRERIQQAINPTIHEFRKEIRDAWADNKAAERARAGGIMGGTEEAEATIAENTPGGAEASRDDLDYLLERARITGKNKRRALIERLSERPVVFHEAYGLAEDSPFIDIATKGSRSLIAMNMNHPFFRKFAGLRDSVLKSGPASGEAKRKLAEDMDASLQILMASFALARGDLNLEDDAVFGTVDRLMHNCTFVLSKNARSMLEK